MFVKLVWADPCKGKKKLSKNNPVTGKISSRCFKAGESKRYFMERGFMYECKTYGVCKIIKYLYRIRNYRNKVRLPDS